MAGKKIEDIIPPKVAEPIPTPEPDLQSTTEHRTAQVQAFEKDSAYFVTLPDGSVVSTRGRFLLTQPGTYVVDGQEYVVEEPTDPSAPIDQDDEETK